MILPRFTTVSQPWHYTSSGVHLRLGELRIEPKMNRPSPELPALTVRRENLVKATRSVAARSLISFR